MEHRSRKSEYKHRGSLRSENQSYHPASLISPHPSFMENHVPHHQHHDHDINSQASHRACRSLYLFSTTTKESQVLFCIHEAGETAVTAVPLQVWQYPAGSLGVVRSGLVITGRCQNTNKFQQSMWSMWHNNFSSNLGEQSLWNAEWWVCSVLSWQVAVISLSLRWLPDRMVTKFQEITGSGYKIVSHLSHCKKKTYNVFCLSFFFNIYILFFFTVFV